MSHCQGCGRTDMAGITHVCPLLDTFNSPPEPQAGSGAPCNICGVNWPFHADACVYKATAEALADARSALRYIEQRYGRLDGVGWGRVLGA